MRRLARRCLFPVSAAASLLLCVAVCVLWVRSRHVADRVEYRRLDKHVLLESSRGILGVTWSADSPPSAKSPAWYGTRWSREAQPSMRTLDVFVRFSYQFHPKIYSTHWQRGRLAYYVWLPSGRSASHRLALAPHWGIAVATAVLPLAWSATRLRSFVWNRWRRSRGCCPTCGYDLRASPGRCPECGTMTAAPTGGTAC